MSKFLELTDELIEYLQGVSLRESEVAVRLRQETAALPMAGMQIAPEQGQFMAWMLKLMGARQVLEIGTFTGYSALVMASALPSDGRLIACDVSEEWTSVGRRYWREAGVESRIELHLGPALTTLQGLQGPFDFAFIDADKTNYDAYYERTLELLRPGGVIALDNVLWSGSVVRPEVEDPDARALRALNQKLHQDTRVDLSMLPLADGLTLCRKIA